MHAEKSKTWKHNESHLKKLRPSTRDYDLNLKTIVVLLIHKQHEKFTMFISYPAAATYSHERLIKIFEKQE
jgi:hypothetical protein